MTADPTPAADPRLAEPFVDEHGFDHADDSYGQCFRCRIWSEGSGDDEVYLSEPWPCPTVRLALLPARTATTEAPTTDDAAMAATREALAEAQHALTQARHGGCGDQTESYDDHMASHLWWAGAVLATVPGGRLTVDTWASHRERCHDNDPDGTIAFLHHRLDELSGSRLTVRDDPVPSVEQLAAVLHTLSFGCLPPIGWGGTGDAPTGEWRCDPAVHAAAAAAILAATPVRAASEDAALAQVLDEMPVGWSIRPGRKDDGSRVWLVANAQGMGEMGDTIPAAYAAALAATEEER